MNLNEQCEAFNAQDNCATVETDEQDAVFEPRGGYGDDVPMQDGSPQVGMPPAAAGMGKDDPAGETPLTSTRYLEPELEGIDDVPGYGTPDFVDNGESEDAPAQSVVPTGFKDPLMRYGYFPVYRAFQSEWWWEDRPWSYAHLFMDILMRANRKPTQINFEGRIVILERGSLVTAITALSERTGWGRKRVRRFLRLMTESGQVAVQDKGQDGIIVKVCKYEAFALSIEKAGHGAGHVPVQRRPTDRYSNDPVTGTPAVHTLRKKIKRDSENHEKGEVAPSCNL